MSYQTDILNNFIPARFFPLNQTSGITANNVAASGPNATYLPNNGTSFTGGTYNYTPGLNTDYGAITLNGTSGTVWVNETTFDGLSNLSIVMSVRPTTIGGFRTLISRFINNNERFEISLGSTGVFNTDRGLVIPIGPGVAQTSSDVLIQNEWNHIVVTFDGTAASSNRVKVYINGVSVTISSSNIPTTIPTMAATPLYIGSRTNNSLHWSGQIQDVVFFNSTLSPSQVTEIYGYLTTVVPSELTGAQVNENGTQINLTFNETTSLAASSVVVRVNNLIRHVPSVSGSGTSWTASLGHRYILPTDTVSVTVGEATVSANNLSNISRRQVQYAGNAFGMFIHFGIETFDPANPLAPEWSLPSVNQNVFAPTGNMTNAIDQWVQSALSANMRYMVLTAKHHYGFTLWPSASGNRGIQYTDWYTNNNQLDLLDIYTTKVRAAGLGVGVYFSVWDRSLANGSPTNQQYINHTVTQLTEILTNYGKIDSLWLDGYAWANNPSLGVPYSVIPYATIYNTVKNLQPDCIIVNNNHEFTLTNSDIVTYELPANVAIPTTNLLPAEASSTVSLADTWFHHENDTAVKSVSTIKSLITSCNTNRLALLLNVPPIRTGFLSENVQRLLSNVGHDTAELLFDQATVVSGNSFGPGFGGNFVGVGGSLGGN